MVCVSVPFSELHEHAYSCCFSCGAFETNYGDVVIHVSFALASYVNMHLFFDVVCTHCCMYTLLYVHISIQKSSQCGRPGTKASRSGCRRLPPKLLVCDTIAWLLSDSHLDTPQTHFCHICIIQGTMTNDLNS